MRGLAREIKKRIVNNTPVGVAIAGAGLISDWSKVRKSKTEGRALEKKLAQQKSPTGEAVLEKGKWVPYTYGK